MRGNNWNNEEIAVTVADYMKMLTLELSGQKYSKTAHREQLLKLLNNRSKSAVELKHQNISAVLQDFQCIWIPGYKPRSNYQKALADFVESWINTHPEFDKAAQAAVEQPAFVPSSIRFDDFRVTAPAPIDIREKKSPYIAEKSISKRDYIAQEARNIALGNAGELLILEYESHRLYSLGMKKLANRIEHISATKGDGFGYDILSFSETGEERYIEVKTTSFAKETPFFASKNEVDFSHQASEQYYLYRVFEFRKNPKFFSLNGEIKKHCKLDPISYICRLL